jgi:DNA-binding winged helix-turn-helix (wHTH) protein/serine/threonine protein kinase
MLFNDQRGREFSGRAWEFVGCEYDESSRQLRVRGEVVEIESKPVDVLYQLLLHAGEVVTKDELLEWVWPGLTVVEGSLATAVSKLRKALGDEDQSIVLTIPRIGYRLGAPVQVRRVSAPGIPELNLNEGDPIPGRDQWRLTRRLDLSMSSEVWLSEHPKTKERRVFKFASDGVRLRGLKREVTLARVLSGALGERDDFVRVLEWNFDSPPFYLESEYGGPNLLEWAEQQGGLAQIPFEVRLKVLVDIGKAVASAHEVGVLHKDLKPANVLITDEAGRRQVKVADFGSGELLEPGRLGQFGITNLGFTTHAVDAKPLTGTVLYIARAGRGGQTPPALADVYALGVMLYQMAAGDFRKPLSASWESDISDPLIREDVAAAACGDPAKRMPAVAALVARLESLESRRAARDELRQAEERARVAERRLAQWRARRPWAIAAMVTLAAGLTASLALYRSAAAERDRANRQTAITADVNRFLANDLLGRSNPFQSGRSNETLADAVKAAAADIDRQFRNEPEVAARLHQAIAKALDNRTDYAAARVEYERAAALFRSAGGAADAVMTDLQRAAMEARTYAEGSLARAKAILAEQEAAIPRLAQQPPELPVWLASARGMIALIGNDAKTAAQQFEVAYEQSRKVPGVDEMAQLTFKQRLAFSQIRLGDGPRAEKLFRELIADFGRLRGPEDPSVLRVRLNLAQAFMIQNKHKEAVGETTAIYPFYVAKLGEDHELTMQVLTTRAQSEGSLGMWDEAVRDDLKIHAMAVKKQGPLSFFAIATLSDAALAQCRAGQLREGEANARRAHDNSVKGFGPRAGLTGGTAHTLASCWIALKRFDEADRILSDIDVKAVAQLAGVADWGANVALSQAEIAYRRGDYRRAKERLEAAAASFEKPEAEAYQRKAVQTLRASLSRVPAN